MDELNQQTTAEELTETLATSDDVIGDSLDKMFDDAGIEAEEPETSEARDRDDKGRFVSTKTEAEDSQPGDSTDDSDASESETAEPSNSKEWQQAYEALKRDSVPNLDELAKSMDADAFEAWGMKRAKVQADVDGYTEKMKAAEARLAELEEGGKSQQDKPEDSDSDADTIAKPFVDAMSEQFGEDFREPAAQMVEALLQKIGNTTDADRVKTLEAKLVAIEQERAREVLLPHYPKLKSQSEFSEVLAIANELPDSKWPTLQAKLDAAAKMQYADDIRDNAARKRSAAARDAGTASTSGKQPSGETSVQTLDELVDARLDAGLDKDNKRASEVAQEIRKRY